MKKIISHLMGTEPSLVLGALTALIALAVGFGLPITPEQVSLIVAAVVALMSVLLRRSVTSPATANTQDELIAELKNDIQEIQIANLRQPAANESE